MDYGRMPGSRRSKKQGGGFGGFRGLRGAGGASFWRIERGMLGLIIASVAVFAACVASQRVLPMLIMSVDQTFRHFQLWRLLTTGFVSTSLAMFVLDLLGLWWIGCFVERAIGTRSAVVMFLACTVFGSLVGGLVGLAWRLPPGIVVGASPALFGMIASTAFIYGRQQVLFFGAMPARADIIAWIFCGIGLAVSLIQGDLMTAAADVAAAAAAWVVVRRGMPSMDLGTRWARLRLWWLRRRYKVLDGGKSREGREKKWMN